ncbi:MAG: T9SS type A sorting domain-containing protein [Saprospiraceae bacterium]
MKKVSTLLAALMLALTAFAQLPDGSIAPNFTGTDLNGNTYTLYDILDQGKSVVMDVSATWCGPCWNYHNTHAMRDLYEAHGPNGDNKVMVFFVEGDPATNTACLSGNMGCVGGTQGNWVDGTPYPIIDDASIADAYETTYFPTIFLICPNRVVTEIGQVSAAKLWEGVQECPVQTGVNNAGILGFSTGSSFTEICGATPASPEFNLTNMGSAPLTSADVTLKWNGTAVQTVNWTGNLGTYAFDKVVFDQVTIDQPGTLEVAIGNVNGGADEEPTNNTKTAEFTAAPEFNTQKVYLRIRTDNYGAELYWEMRDDQGNVLDHGGNEAVGPDGGGQYQTPPAHPSAYGNAQTIRDTLVLPANGCYSMHFVDAYGDGICCSQGQGYYRMYNLGNTADIILEGGEFEAVDDRPFGGSGFLNVDDLVPAADFEVFPNPATSVLNIDFVLTKKANVSIYITNSLGQVVQSETTKTYSEGFHPATLQLNTLANGMYFINLRTEAGTTSKRFVVQK